MRVAGASYIDPSRLMHLSRNSLEIGFSTLDITLMTMIRSWDNRYSRLFRL